MDNTSVLERVFEKVIKTWSDKEQTDFLKVYPIFKFREKIIDLWIKIYAKTNKSLQKKYDSEKSKGTLRRSMTLTNDSVLKYINYKKNIVNFLEIALKKGYVILTALEIAKIDATIKQFDNDKHIIDLMNFYTVYYQNLNKIDLSPLIKSSDQIIQLSGLNSKYIAEQMTLHLSKIYQSITAHELIFRAMHDDFTEKDCHHFTKMANAFNKYLHWVPTEILFNCTCNDQRIRMVNNFIEIAIELKKLKNYHLYFAIIGGLNNMSVQRLKMLWEPDAEHTKKFIELEKIVVPLNNYNNYQREIKNIKDEPFIPFMGLIIKNLKHSLDAPLIHKNKLNKIQYNLIVNQIKIFESYNKCYDIQKNLNIINYLLNLAIITDVEKLFAQSTEIRDNGKLVTQSLDTMPMVPVVPLYAIPAKAKLVRTTSDGDMLSSRRDQIQYDKVSQTMRTSPRGAVKPRPRSVSISSQDIHNCDWTLTIQRKDEQQNDNIPVEKWSVDQISIWLDTVGLSEYKELFKQHAISGAELVDLNETILGKMGINRIGHQMKLVKEINLVKSKAL